MIIEYDYSEWKPTSGYSIQFFNISVNNNRGVEKSRANHHHHPKKNYSVRGDEGSKNERKRKLLENNKPKKEIK